MSSFLDSRPTSFGGYIPTDYRQFNFGVSGGIVYNGEPNSLTTRNGFALQDFLTTSPVFLLGQEGDSFTLQGGNATSTNTNGVDLTLQSGTSTSANGANINIASGTSSNATTSNGGDITITGADTNLTASTGSGGSVIISGGSSQVTNGDGGDITLKPGMNSGSGTDGALKFTLPTTSSTITYTWPTTPPAANAYVLSSTTSGTMTWEAAGGAFTPIAANSIPVSDGTNYVASSNTFEFRDTGAGNTQLTSGAENKTFIIDTPAATSVNYEGCDIEIVAGDAGTTSGRAGSVYIQSGEQYAGTTGVINFEAGANNTDATFIFTGKQSAGNLLVIIGQSQNATSTTTGTMRLTGGLGVTQDVYAANYFATSDARLKTNIETLTNPLDLISKLRGVTFTWKDDVEEQTKHSGFIAQEVLNVAQTHGLEGLVGGDPEDHLSVNYVGFVPILCEAVKELKASFEEEKKSWNAALREERNAWKDEIQSLREEINLLRSELKKN